MLLAVTPSACMSSACAPWRAVSVRRKLLKAGAFLMCLVVRSVGPGWVYITADGIMIAPPKSGSERQTCGKLWQKYGRLALGRAPLSEI